MTGLYSNSIRSLNSHFLFIEGKEYGKSCRLSFNKYSKVGKFEPLSFEGNFMCGTGCLIRWNE
jgi:hypothetical protein